MTRVDGEQLSLDVRGQVVHPRGVRDRRLAAAERPALDRPLEVGLDRHVQALVAGLAGHDAVDRGVRENGAGGEGLPLLVRYLRAHVLDEHVRRVDRVLARHHGQRRGAPSAR